MVFLDSLIVLGLTSVSLGTIYEANGVQERRFLLRNEGSQTVTMLQGYGSCGCTTVHFERGRQVAPSDTASIVVRFNPKGKGGEFHETATLEYGPASKSSQTHSKTSTHAARKHLQMSLTGTCITSEETLMRQYPIRINNRLRLSTNHYDLGVMHVGETKERHVSVLHCDENNRKESLRIRFTVDATTPKGVQHIDYPLQILSKGHKVTAHVTLDVLIK